MNIKIEELNELSMKEWRGKLGHLYEHSPWVVSEARIFGPFTSVKAIQAAMESVLYSATIEAQVTLIRAHPDLAAKLDQLEKLTESSQLEQKRAGFAALPETELQKLRSALTAYREKFEHPFILCVTEHPANDVLPILETRLQGTIDSERLACLFQIARIGWHRLNLVLQN